MALLTPEFAREGFDIVELKLSRYKQDSRLQIFIDSDDGVSIADCTRLSKTITPILDLENTFPGEYTLEISSPGLDRPLETARDFRRRIGKRIEVVFVDGEKKPIKGELVEADEETIKLNTGQGMDSLKLNDIKMGKVIFDGV